MKISQGIFVVVCIVFTIHQIVLVECDQALGTKINSMSLNTIANRDRLLGGSNTGGITNPAASFQIWIKGIQTADYNAVVGAINGAGCSLISSNINNNAKGLPHWNYVVARMTCSTLVKWKNLVYNQAFYSRVAFTERSYTVDNVLTSPTSDGCKKRFTQPPRIALWNGKVNQHTMPAGNFATDPDGQSAAGVDKLAYCRKFYNQTTGVRDYQIETLTTFRDYGNTGVPATKTLMTTECIQPSGSCKREARRVDPSVMPDLSEKDISFLREIHDNMMRSISEYNSSVRYFIENKRVAQCPENPVKRQEMFDAIENVESEEEKNALRKALTQACDTSSGSGTPPPPYYPPPPSTPPPSTCPQPYIERELQEQIDAAETEEERAMLQARIAAPSTNCPPPPPPPPPPYVPPSDFVCSQVNEGSNAVLTCPSGKVIKKIEFASYGTAPAFSACAQFPTPKFGTCNSANTEYLVHQKCCGQSTCTVPATDAFFINPYCSGAKSLRIKVVCDYASKVECTMPICGIFNENTNVQLTCPSGLVMKSIDFVAWSNEPTLYCQTGFGIPGICYQNQAQTKNKIETACKDKSSCSFTASNTFFGGDPCPGKPKQFAVKASCATHAPYNWGFDQSTSMQPSSNYAWESANGRPWTNYLENMGWSSTVDYYNSVNGGTFYSLDLGIYENHPELLNVAVNPPVTRVKRLPNLLNPDVTKQMNGFIDPELLAWVGEDAYLEATAAHGTTNAALLIGNTLGLARGVQLYYAKVGSADIGLDSQAFGNALASVNQLTGTTGHPRPSVVVAPFNFQFGYGYCYSSRVNAVPPEPTCTQFLMDEFATAYEKGTIIVIPSHNGFNFYDLYSNPVTGFPFSIESATAYPKAAICDREPISAIPINICNSASRVHDSSFNVWDMYLPVVEKTTQKPFIVAAHDQANRISRWRDIVYNSNDADWTVPWWSIGSSNVGPCIDFSSFGVQLSKTAANFYAIEDGHYFTNGYRENPYYISGTSYATATAAAVAMYTYGRYGGQSYSGQNIENMRYYMANYANRNYDDVDTCRNNYWTVNEDTRSYPRLKFV